MPRTSVRRGRYCREYRSGVGVSGITYAGVGGRRTRGKLEQQRHGSVTETPDDSVGDNKLVDAGWTEAATAVKTTTTLKTKTELCE